MSLKDTHFTGHPVISRRSTVVFYFCCMREARPGIPGYTKFRKYLPEVILSLVYLIWGLGTLSFVYEHRFPDTEEYLRLRNYIWHGTEYGHNVWLQRSLSIPLLYALLYDPVVIKIFQALVYFGSFMALAWALSRYFRQRTVQVAVYIFPLLFSCCAQLVFWPGLRLSEALSVAFLNLVIIFFLEGFRRPLPRQAWIMFPLAVLFFSHLRDAHAYMTIFLFIPVLFMIPGKKKWRMAGIYALLFAGNFFVQAYLIQEGGRYKIPLGNVLFQRILPFEDRLQWFLREGMPEGEYLDTWRWKWAMNDGFPDDPHFMEYLEQQGTSDYRKFLVTHPYYTYDELRVNYDESINMSLWEYAGFRGNYLLLALDPVLWPDSDMILYAWCVAALLFLVRRRFWTIGLMAFTFLVFYSQLLVCFHGDAFELLRHCLLPNYLFRLMGIAWLLLALENLVNGKKEKSLLPGQKA